MVATPSDDPMIGQTILNSHRIVKKLGEGGMGAVYLARSPNLGTEHAVKVLHAEHSHNESLLNRFVGEARIAAALKKEWRGESPFVPVIEVGRIGDQWFMVMEYLDGGDLDQHLQRLRAKGTRSELEDALRILGQVCAALEAVHHVRVVHRDLKPANIFIAPTAKNPLHVKVLDFGIAKLTDSVVESEIQTGQRVVVGTLSYMAPEQAADSKNVDESADIYSLGVLAYEMVCGRRPYRVENFMQVFEPNKEIADPCFVRPSLPEKWGALIMSMLSFEPKDRPSSALLVALGLADALPNGREILADVAPLLLSPRWIQRTRKLRGSALKAFTRTADRTKPDRLAIPKDGDTSPLTHSGSAIPKSIHDDEGTPVPVYSSPPTTLTSAASEMVPVHEAETVAQKPSPVVAAPIPSSKRSLVRLVGAALAMAAVAGGAVVLVGLLSRGSASTPLATPTSSTENENAIASPNDDPPLARTIDAGASATNAQLTVGEDRGGEPVPVDAGVPSHSKLPPKHASKRSAETAGNPEKRRPRLKRAAPTKQEPAKPIVKKPDSGTKKPARARGKETIETSKPLWGN